jgi:hypothetical protein
MDLSEDLEALRRDPRRVYDLSPRRFEEVVAELLASFGWEISLRSRTGDEGFDMLGISRSTAGSETARVVQCRLHTPDRPVGRREMRRLVATRELLRMPRALLVAPSGVTRDAAEFAEKFPGIDIADFDVFAEWLSRYVPPAGVAHAIANSFRSCFVSYNHTDEAFASRLVDRLQSEGVRVWYAPKDLRPGQKIHEEVERAIESFDRLIVVLSEHSMSSRWVHTEIRRARGRELRDGTRMLFPVSLVPFDVLRSWQLFDSDAGQDLAVEIREYLIPDFSGWEDPAVFDRELEALLAGLSDNA